LGIDTVVEPHRQPTPGDRGGRTALVVAAPAAGTFLASRMQPRSAGEDVTGDAREVRPLDPALDRPALFGRLSCTVQEQSVRTGGVQVAILDDGLDRRLVAVGD